MQRFSQRESVLLGYSPQKTFMESSSSPDKSSDIDFNDVFGGPPRRSSIQESRYSFGDDMDSYSFRRSDEMVASSRNPWSGLREKPVFGEEAVSNRRRYSRNEFFDDIFKGNESLGSSPRKYEMKDPFSPGSQLLSPAKPLPPKAEPFGTSLPAQFSLPAKMNKGMDLRTFGSPTRGIAHKSKDAGSLNGSNHYAFSPLSKVSSISSEESANLEKSNGTETNGNPKEDSKSPEISKNGSHFHFSIYKWADKGGVPLAIPIRGSDRVKEKDKLQRCSSANGWIACENIAMEPKDLHGSFRSTDRMSRNSSRSFRVEHDKKENGPVTDSRNEDGKSDRVIEEISKIPMSESEIVSGLKSSDKNVSADNDLHNAVGQEKTYHSLPPTPIDLRDKREKEASTVGKKTNKPQSKPQKLSSEEQAGNDKKTRNSGTKGNTKKLSEYLDDNNIKNQDVKKKATPKDVEAGKTSAKSSPRNSWDNGKNKVRGKVKEFIKIFNQDGSSKPKTDDVSEGHSSARHKERDTVKAENKPSASNNERNESSGEIRNEKTHKTNIQKKKSSTDIPVVNQNGASEKKNSSVKDTVSNGSKTVVEDPAESFDNFLVEDLTPEEKIVPEFGIDPEELKAIDTKIRQWSNGKQGNIRSLLSTLQYVLWPNSGWKPVPLVDIIEGPSVKRSYQKALLCLHPDKLQQKGAASDQKYIAEKVFDILQDAWTHFNSLGSV
ncbi:hypothetical protein CCACVL1_08877 [Corchorus capsularis]|uniref:J domain-containing protein n=1 Tax=Corchorus capsularis TaxID=210143 RepID=A0A1R3IYH5_COCAP|nr:hypothetical protein CCACVL1_08877 [Corchorus capsularis]